MEQRKHYEELEAEIIRFDADDVITTSGDNAGHSSGGGYSFPVTP